MDKYGPLTDEIMDDARDLVWAQDPEVAEVAEILYNWYVKGLTEGINLGMEQ